MNKAIFLSLVMMILASCASVPKAETGLSQPLQLKVVQADANQFRREDSIASVSKSPYSPSTRIVFGVSQKDSTTIMFYDSKGKLISDVFSQVLDVGAFRVDFDNSELPSGVYVAWYKIGDKVTTKKFMLLR